MARHRHGVVGVVALGLVILAGCASLTMYPLPSTVERLQTDGYTRTVMYSTTATGERRENTNYQIWWKEFRQQGRICHFCFVPGPRLASAYNWKIAVSVDDRQVWEWQSGGFQGKPATQTGISCTETPPLPEGRVNWLVSYVYWS